MTHLIFTSDGKSLAVEEIWRLIPRFYSQFDDGLDKEQLITMITQFVSSNEIKKKTTLLPLKTFYFITILKLFFRSEGASDSAEAILCR